jgi:hypothetical protein
MMSPSNRETRKETAMATKVETLRIHRVRPNMSVLFVKIAASLRKWARNGQLGSEDQVGRMTGARY